MTKEFLEHAAIALRSELITRPLIHERVTRYLNEENQLRLARHLVSGTAQRAYSALIVPTPWRAKLNRIEAFEYVIAVLESEKGESPMLQEAEMILRHLLESMHATTVHVKAYREREEFWSEVRKQWYKERGR